MTTTPRHILCVGRNYLDHAKELGHDAPKSPLFFWKPSGSLVQGSCALPRWAEGPTRIDFEGEVVLVLGREVGPGAPALPSDPWDAVSGVAAGLDITDRDLQKLEPQWVRAKGFHGACAVGAPMARPADPDDVRIGTWKNGARVQEGHTSQLIFGFRDLLVYLAGFCRLGPGDLIFTGTPAGVGPLAVGDRLRVVAGVGRAGGPEAGLDLVIAEGPRVAPFTRGAWRT